MAHPKRTFISKLTLGFRRDLIHSIEEEPIDRRGAFLLSTVVLTAASESTTVDLLADSVRRRSERIPICNASATAGRVRVSPWSRKLLQHRLLPHSTDSYRCRCPASSSRYRSTDRRLGFPHPWTASRCSWPGLYYRWMLKLLNFVTTAARKPACYSFSPWSWSLLWKPWWACCPV